jgi:predicted metalloprotease
MADWGRIRSRGNVEDRRGFAPVAGGLSLTTVALIVAFNYFTGGDLGTLLQHLGSAATTTTETRRVTDQYDGEDSYERFASQVLGSNNDIWRTTFDRLGEEYPEPRLVLFRTATESACGTATSQVGPHYCPLDETIYIDETFFDELTSRLGAQGGDVAEAYVIAHEVGHHVQNKLGTLQQVQSAQQYDPDGGNEGSIRLELQADCYAGIWANALNDDAVFEPGEIREAMDAAAAVGDDRIQERVTGQVNPETWTHGSSDQRVEWFTRGYQTGSLEACDTFR